MSDEQSNNTVAKLFIWDYSPPSPGEPGNPMFGAIALDEATARARVIEENQEDLQVPDYQWLVAGNPPTRVVELKEGFAFVIKSQDWGEAG